MKRKRHPDKVIEAAVKAAESAGWRIEMTPGGHCWARMYCPWNDPDCRCGEFCIASIWSTPRNPENHARQIIRIVERCSGRKQETNE